MPPTRCTATAATGHPCRAWAIPGSDPPRCAAHRGAAHRGAAHGGRAGGAPPGNQNARTHGFYSTALHDHELADLVAAADNLTLDDEIACMRVVLRRLMEQIHTPACTDGSCPPPEPADYARLTALALQAARTVARLLRDRRALSGDAADGLMGAVSQALDELATEWGVEL